MTARVVHSYPIVTHTSITVWAIALELDQPRDVWMVNPLLPDSSVGCSGTACALRSLNNEQPASHLITTSGATVSISAAIDKGPLCL